MCTIIVESCLCRCFPTVQPAVFFKFGIYSSGWTIFMAYLSFLNNVKLYNRWAWKDARIWSFLRIYYSWTHNFLFTSEMNGLHKQLVSVEFSVASSNQQGYNFMSDAVVGNLLRLLFRSTILNHWSFNIVHLWFLGLVYC